MLVTINSTRLNNRLYTVAVYNFGNGNFREVTVENLQAHDTGIKAVEMPHTKMWMVFINGNRYQATHEHVKALVVQYGVTPADQLPNLYKQIIAQNVTDQKD